MRQCLIALLICAFAAAACAQQPVTFLTADNLRIHADWYESIPASNRVLLMLHMNGHDRSDWRDFAPVAVDSGLHVLAIDLRGHGESVEWGRDTLQFAELTPADYAAMMLDLDAAIRWIRQSLGKVPVIGIIGASIGANLAICYAAVHPEIHAVILISPGLNYRELKPAAAMKKFEPRSALLIAAKDDNYSSVSVQELTRECGPNTTAFLYENGGHGTYLFEAHTDLSARLIDYLKQHLQ